MSLGGGPGGGGRGGGPSFGGGRGGGTFGGGTPGRSGSGTLGRSGGGSLGRSGGGSLGDNGGWREDGGGWRGESGGRREESGGWREDGGGWRGEGGRGGGWRSGRGAQVRPGFLWAAPATVFFIAFGIMPIAIVAYLSLTRWNGLGSPEWAGLENWRALPDDSDALNGIKVTFLLTLLCWVIQTPVALLLGVWSAGTQRGRALLSTVFFVPLLLSTTAIALTWLSLLDPNFGLAASLGGSIGNLLGSSSRALYAVAFVIAWQFVPFHTLLYQAAARQIPTSMYEDAELAGATSVRQFFAITLPQLRNTIIASSVVIIVGSLTYFESILLLTGGGPGTATRVLPLHMYIKGFVGFDMGFGSALAVLLVAVGTVLSILIVRSTGYHRMTSEREGYL